MMKKVLKKQEKLSQKRKMSLKMLLLIMSKFYHLKMSKFYHLKVNKMNKKSHKIIKLNSVSLSTLLVKMITTKNPLFV